MTNEDLLHAIAITLVDGIGDIKAKKLIAYCGGIEAVFRESTAALKSIPGVGDGLAKAIRTSEVLHRAEQEARFIEENDIQPLCFLDECYPQRLKRCDDGPVMLYANGNVNLNPARVVAVVGTRQATRYGREVTVDLVEGLKEHGVTVVSGLAYGIDICAHRAAMNNGIPTVGVMAHGLDRIYPPSHERTAHKMRESGGCVTEFLSGTNPDRENFPKRNRIVAGMCDAVVVVQSKRKGGAIITADIANSYHRDVFAVPGRVDEAVAHGCNFLIKSHRAALLESAADIAYVMGWEKISEIVPEPELNLDDLSQQEVLLIQQLQKESPRSVDELCTDCNLTMNEATTILLNLEFSGLVKTLPGKMYSLERA